MADGRRGGFHDQQLRIRELHVEATRKKGIYHQSTRTVERDSGTIDRDRNRVRVRSNDSGDFRDRDSANGYGRSPSSTSNSSGGSGNTGDRVRPSSGKSVDREPGELSSGSDDDSQKPKGRYVGEGKAANSNGVLSSPARKRKFSPIVWDRDDSKRRNTPPVGTRIAIRDSTMIHEQLPPPPPLPEGFFHPSKSGESARSSVHPSPSESGPSAEPLVYDNGGGDHLMVDVDGEDEFVPARNISASRWAAGDDELEDDVVMKGASGSRRRNGTPKEISSDLKENKRVLTPELGEFTVRDRSGEASSGSSGTGSDDDGLYRGFERDRKDYVDVEGEDSDLDGDEGHSDSDGGDDDNIVEGSETARPPLRCIDMLQGCRSVDEFERLNKINEGTYGVVYRAKDKKTEEVVALKKVKMEKEREGFPMTSLREINILLSFHHPSIVDVKEVVVGSSLDSIFMVMEYMEHDLKGLMESMKQPFSQSEVKCLMLQLLEGVKYLHDNWVLHRDLKTSNLLFNNRGELKICDFGLSRQYGSPLKPYTHLVVTLWYRAPELLLGMKEYSTAIDMWSLGCIMAELLAKEPLFNGKTELDQLDKIFRILGTPNEKIWPGFSKLPGVKVNFVKQPYNKLREKFPPTSFSGRPTLSEKGFDLLNKLLTYDPEKRFTAEAALKHEWFKEVPLPKSKDFMPTFPAQHAQDRRLRRVLKSPDPLEEQRRKELQQGEIGTGSLFG